MCKDDQRFCISGICKLFRHIQDTEILRRSLQVIFLVYMMYILFYPFNFLQIFHIWVQEKRSFPSTSKFFKIFFFFEPTINSVFVSFNSRFGKSLIFLMSNQSLRYFVSRMRNCVSLPRTLRVRRLQNLGF